MTEQRARELLAAEQDAVGLHASAMLVRSGKPSLSDLAAIRAITTALSTNDGEKYRLMLLDLLAVIHRDGGHRTQELGIKLSYEQALQLSSERQFAESAKSPSDSVREALAIEQVAQFLHDEGGFDEASSSHTWPEHAADTGQRDGGFVKIVPSDVQAKFRDVARRLLTMPVARAALQSSEADNG